MNDGAKLPVNTAVDNSILAAYSLKSDNTKVDLSAKNYTSIDSVTSASFNGDSKTLTYDNSGSKSAIVASDAAVFVYVGGTDNKWKAYTASSLGTFSANAGSKLQFIMDDNKIVALAMVASSFPTGGSDSTAYGYVTERIDTQLNGDNVVALTIWNGSNDVTVYVDGTTCSAYVGDFVEYPVVSDNTKVSNSDITIDDSFSTSSDIGTVKFAIAKVKSVEEKRIITTTDKIDTQNQVIAGTDTAWTVTSDTKYIGVDTEDHASSTNNSVIAYTKSYQNDFNNVAIIYEVKSGYNEIKAIFIDENNKLIPYTNGAAGSATGTPTAIAANDIASATNIDGTNNGIKVATSSNKTTAITGELVTVTATFSGTASADTRIQITGTEVDNPKITSVTGATKISDDTFMIAKDATSATVVFTYEMGSSVATPSFTGTTLYTASIGTVDSKWTAEIVGSAKAADTETVKVKVTNVSDDTNGYVSVTASNSATVEPDTSTNHETCGKGQSVEFTVTLSTSDTTITVTPESAAS